MSEQAISFCQDTGFLRVCQQDLLNPREHMIAAKPTQCTRMSGICERFQKKVSLLCPIIFPVVSAAYLAVNGNGSGNYWIFGCFICMLFVHAVRRKGISTSAWYVLSVLSLLAAYVMYMAQKNTIAYTGDVCEAPCPVSSRPRGAMSMRSTLALACVLLGGVLSSFLLLVMRSLRCVTTRGRQRRALAASCIASCSRTGWRDRRQQSATPGPRSSLPSSWSPAPRRCSTTSTTPSNSARVSSRPSGCRSSGFDGLSDARYEGTFGKTPEITVGKEGVGCNINVFLGPPERAKEELAKREATEDSIWRGEGNARKARPRRSVLRPADVALEANTFYELSERAKEELVRREAAHEAEAEETEEKAWEGMALHLVDPAHATNLIHGLQQRANEELARRAKAFEEARKAALAIDRLREKAIEELARREAVDEATREESGEAHDESWGNMGVFHLESVPAMSYFAWLQQRAAQELAMREETRKTEADQAQSEAFGRIGICRADVVSRPDPFEWLEGGGQKEHVRRDAAEAEGASAEEVQNRAYGRTRSHRVDIVPRTDPLQWLQEGAHEQYFRRDSVEDHEDVVSRTGPLSWLDKGAQEERARRDAVEDQNKASGSMGLHLAGVEPLTGIAGDCHEPTTAILPPIVSDPWLMHEQSMPTE